MAVFPSPGVYSREIDLSATPTAAGGVTPAFVGTATKGPVGVPVLLTNAAQAIDVFGPPSSTSYMMHGILAFFEDGSQCWAMRVAVAAEEGQDEALADVAIDLTGSKVAGWGRLPIFSGIDFGRINLREVSVADPLEFHDASVATVVYNDDSNDGAEASLDFLGDYEGDVDDVYVMTILTEPSVTDEAVLGGCDYSIVKASDGEEVASGTLEESGNPSVSTYIDIGSGLQVRVVVADGALDVGDSFTVNVVANNRDFAVSVEGETPVTCTMPAASYTSVETFTDAFNGELSGDYIAVSATLSDGTEVPQIRTTIAGERIQLTGTAAFAATVGVSQYSYDIPRGHLLGLSEGPYLVTTSSNRVVIDVIGQSATTRVTSSLSTGNLTAETVASVLHAAGIVDSVRIWDAFALTIPGGTDRVVVVTNANNPFDALRILADYSNLKTLNFSNELDIRYPYTRSYRGFNDTRVSLPEGNAGDASVPASCDNPSSNECADDTAYYANIVGWLVASTPGTWADALTVSLSLFTEGVGETAGRYKIVIKENGVVTDSIDDISFDKNAVRYIANVINPDSTIGGLNGNKYVNWEARPTYLENDPSTDDYVIRQPSQLNDAELTGTADGVPTDPAFSSDIDAAVIGNPALNTGMYGFQNPDTYDINLLLTPGFSSGAVIGQALQLCEARGDTIYLVDPPFGLRPQQIVDWHNGMLTSELSAAINSSFGSLGWSWVKIFDQYNRINIWIPPSGKIAAIYARSARVGEPWTPPAGPRRGVLTNVLDVEYSPSLGERNLLQGSGNAVNPLVKFPQEGIVLFGQRTLQRASTSLDSVSTRLLLTYMRKNMERLMRSFLFEFNDDILWSQVRNTINPFMGDIASRRGVSGYRVVVDESNNTPERRGRKELWVTIFFIPEPTAEVIVLNYAMLRQNASFTSEEILAAGGIG